MRGLFPFRRPTSTGPRSGSAPALLSNKPTSCHRIPSGPIACQRVPTCFCAATVTDATSGTEPDGANRAGSSADDTEDAAGLTELVDQLGLDARSLLCSSGALASLE
jgi:hypothetical protein